MDLLLEANGNFALNLLKRLGEDSSNNVFFSPLSISAALAMVFMGAKGKTESQMAQALSFDKRSSPGGGDVHQGVQSLLAAMNKSDRQHILKVANKLFGEKSYDILSSFKDSCRKFYHAEVEKLDFISATEQSRKHINTWVAEKTEGKIAELLSPGAVDATTALILVNAIYFKGNWETPFNKAHTREMSFKVSKKKEKPVQMMFQKSEHKINYVEEISTQILMLPYVGREMNMIILLPDEHVDLRTVEKEITYEKLTEWTRMEKMHEEEVCVYLPRFTLEENYDMGEVLRGLGMTEAFDQTRADFSGMSSKKGLCLSKVVHKSFLEVNEEGTEATAASGAVLLPGSTRYTPYFCADRPFLLFIQERETKMIMFCGRVASP